VETRTEGDEMPKEVLGVELYSTTEVAKALDVTERSVYQYIKDGRLKGVKYGRSWHISEANLRAFLEGKDQADETTE